jgi:hypothetical protein
LCKTIKDKGYTVSYVEKPKGIIYFDNTARVDAYVENLSIKRNAITDNKACVLGKPSTCSKSTNIEGWINLNFVADKFKVTLVDEKTGEKLEEFKLNSENAAGLLKKYGNDMYIKEILSDFNSGGKSYNIEITALKNYMQKQDQTDDEGRPVYRVRFSGSVNASEVDLLKLACITLYRYPTKEESGNQLKKTSDDFDYDVTEYGIAFLQCALFFYKQDDIADLSSLVAKQLKGNINYIPFSKNHFSVNKDDDTVITDIYSDKKDVIAITGVDKEQEKKVDDGEKKKRSSRYRELDEIQKILADTNKTKEQMLSYILHNARPGDISRIVKLAINKYDNGKMGRDQWLQIARSNDFLTADDLKRAITAVVGDYEKKMAEKSKEAGN